MKIKITKKEISHLYQHLMSSSIGLYRGIKFCHAISRNLAFLKTPFNDMVKSCMFDEDVNVFVKKWIHLGSEEMIEQMGIELKKDPSLQSLVDRASSKVKANADFLNEEIEVDLYQIHMHDLPEDIRSQDFQTLERIIIMPEDKQS